MLQRQKRSTSTKEYKWQDEEKEEAYLTAKKNKATAQINLGSEEKEGSVLGHQANLKELLESKELAT